MYMYTNITWQSILWPYEWIAGIANVKNPNKSVLPWFYSYFMIVLLYHHNDLNSSPEDVF